MLANNLQLKWIRLEKNKIENPERPKRRYLHFDYRITKISQAVVEKIWIPDYIVRHSFYPFIKKIHTTRRHKHDEEKNTRIIKPKDRPICYASHFDALIFSWYAFLLNNSYERKIRQIGIHNNVIAYRELHKSNVDFVKEIFGLIHGYQSCVALCFDIEGFFDNLDHKLLKEAWCSIQKTNEKKLFLPSDHYVIYKIITKYSFIYKKNIISALGIKRKKELKKFKRYCDPKIFRQLLKSKNLPIESNGEEKGIPQGSPISAILSNIYMLGFDQKMNELTKSIGGIYRRYSDDIIVICPIEHKEKIKIMVQEEIQKLLLIIQKEKTDTSYFVRAEDGTLMCLDEKNDRKKMQYLGIEIDGEKITLRPGTLARFYRRMTETIDNRVRHAYKKNSKNIHIPKKKIYEKYTNFGKQNFISYVKKVIGTLNANNLNSIISPMRLMKKVQHRIEQKKEKYQKKSDADK